MQKIVLVVGLVTSFTALAQGSTNTERMASARIVGGQVATKSDWPFITYVDIGSGFCGGSLIGDRYVLTAAHCVEEKSPNDLKVYVGPKTTLERLFATPELVRSYYIHKDYNGTTFANDIAIIELENTVNTPKVALATEVEVSALNTATSTLTAAGGGTTSFGGASSDSLLQVALPYVDRGTCQNIGGNYSTVGSYSICSGQIGKDTCQGDSGGPLVLKDGTEIKQVGIVSWGYGCAKANAYGVYSNVGYFKTNGWIEKNTSGVSHSPDILLQAKSGEHSRTLEVKNLIDPNTPNDTTFNVTSVQVPSGVTLIANNCTANLRNGDACTIDINIDASTVYANSDKAIVRIMTDHQTSSELPISIVYSYEDRNAQTLNNGGNGSKGGGSTTLGMMLLAMFGFALRARKRDKA